MTTALDKLIDEGVGVLRQLRKADTDRKLNYRAFFTSSVKIASSSEKRIAEVEKIIAERHGVEEIVAFVRRYAKALAEPNYTRPFPDPSKAVRIFGSDGLNGQMGQHGIQAGELQALAVKTARERFGDDVFGTVKDFDQHERRTKKLRERLQLIHERMREVFSGADMEIDTSRETLMPSEIARGLARVTFKRSPDISPADGEWSSRLVEAAERELPPRRKRETLNDSASAAAV